MTSEIDIAVDEYRVAIVGRPNVGKSSYAECVCRRAAIYR